MAGSIETILVVDDAAWVANSIVSILEGSHFIVLRANSGLDALKLATDYRRFDWSLTCRSFNFFYGTLPIWPELLLSESPFVYFSQVR
jgi:hypothetical protein